MSTTQASPRIPVTEVPAVSEAPGAVPLRVAIALSGARCILTYVVAPVLSSVAIVAVLVGPIGLWLHLLAVGSVGYGTVRMWRARRPGRVPYSVLALLVAVLSFAGFVNALTQFRAPNALETT